MKLRNLAGAFLAFACAAFCGNLRAGNVWEFIPDSPTGVAYQPGEEITFRMRLLTPNYEKPEDQLAPWTLLPNMDNAIVAQTFLSDPTHAMEILQGLYPFQIGVVANGRTYGATFVTANVTNGSYATDFTFRYPVQCGDFALPLRLAADRNGTPVNSWDPDSSKASNRYFFFYGPDDANYIWKIHAEETAAAGGRVFAFVPQMVGQAEAELTIMEREVLPYNAAGDYLRGFKWTLETLAFDEVTEPGDDGKDYWRCVRGTSRPTIVPTDGLILDSGRRVYAWIAPAGGSDDDPNTWTGWTENDYAVTIPLDGDRNVAEMVFRDPDGTSRKHNVYTFTLAPGQTSYELRELKGLHVGGTARVILSGSPHWNMVGNGSTGTFLTTDYRMRTVYCGEQKPTISVSLDNYSTTTAVVFPNANHELRDYTRAERLRVRLEGVDVHEAFKVKLAFDLAGDTAFPTNVIAISTDEAAGYLDKNLLKGMEVSFAENADEATESEDGLYLFLLGATTNTTVNPGITITPVPNASLTATVQKTNALHVVIRGINPVVTAVNDVEAEPGVPVAVKEVRGGGNLECRVRIEDSYRNLRLLDAGGTDGVYTVTFNRGYGNSLTITNNASGGALVPVDYFSDGYAYLDFKVPYTSITNTYTATFKLKNPDGLESKTYVLTVPVIPSAKVAASAPEGKVTSDGFYELMEDSAKSYRIDFTLSDTLEAEAAGYDKLYAFLEPVNEAASNRTDGTFFTKCADGKAGTGVPIDMLGENRGKGSTAWGGAGGGIKILDGDGAGDGSGQTARYNVVLCTQPTYSNEFVFAGYDGSTTKFTLILDNHEPTLKQLVISEVIKGESSVTTNDIDVITASGKAAANRVHKGNDVIVGPMTKDDWKDVPYDIDATNADLMVTRWLVYRLNDSGEKERWDAYYTYGPDEKLVIPGGLTVYGGKDTTYLFEAQIQDKDMRALGTAGLIEDEDEASGWAYRVYKNLPNFEPDWAGDDEANVWGPLFTFTVVASDKPNVDIVVREEGSTLVQGVRAFGEDQLAPLNGSIYSDDDMRLVVSLAEQYDRKTEVKVLLTLSAVDNMNVNGGFVKLAETNVYFVGANRSAEVKISDFDATYRDGKVQRGYAKYQVMAEVVEPAGAKEKFNATTCQFFVVNRPPRLELGAGSQQFAEYLDNPEMAYDVAKNDIQTVDWSATDIHYDLTNISVKATISGGKIIDGAGVEYTTYTYAATNSAVVATNYEDGAYNVAFKFKFSSSGTNTITFVATDKDGDSSERHVLRFAIPETKTLLLYPAKPTQPSTDSDDIADYFSAAGIGYGRVWADGDTKLSAIDKWIHDWTCSQGGVAKVYAMGYLANEREDNTSSAFVNTSGTGDTGTGYSPADENATFKHLDSFFYRWFAKLVAESGSDSNWTAYKPVPQVSTNRSTAAAGTVMSMSFPKKTGVNDREYNDISALAIFSRELLKSDNMGDINADGVPDSYVVKYKLVEEFAGGNDLKDVNYAEDGSTPYCLDYLPQVLTVRYSELIPELTEISNIENAEAFTPRLKIRGYDETDVKSLARRRSVYGAVAELVPGISALNDAADLAGIDGAKPDRRYTNPREDADSTLNYVEWLAWSEYAAVNLPEGAVTNKAYFSRWSPERPTDPTKADFDNDGFTDGYEYYVWYRAHVGYIDTDGCHRYLTGREYDPRNPGEGKFISSERIVELFDPRAKGASSTQDTDNDGLPDLIEFEIGTNPFDFDSDGDGLPDGFEIIVAGTDPLTDHTAKDAKHDAERNYDGDAMAFTTVKREADVLPLPRFIQRYNTFATVDPNGDTDGIQWYVETPLDGGASAFTYTNGTVEAGVKFTADGVDYVTTAYTNATDLPVVDGRLAVTLEPLTTFTVGTTNDAVEVLGIDLGEADCLRLRPTRVLAGTPLKKTSGQWAVNATCAAAQIMDIAEKDKCNAAWTYGSEKVNISGHEFGFLALGRYQLPKGVDKEGNPGAVVAELPSKDRDVAFLHYLVYQQFGFDPRTAWSPKTPLAARWGKTDSQGQAFAEQVGKLGYAGTSTRTRAFTAYDEFLLYSFFLNNGCDMSGYTEAAAEAPYLAKVWMAFCTNPRGTGEPAWASDKHYQGWTAQRDENGCDTDGDGVPDGWELYVMAGPKVGKGGKADPKDGKFVFAPPYAAFTAAGEEVIEMPKSYFSPFVDAAKDGATDNVKYIGKDMSDSLTEYDEFVSTDACAYYDEVQSGETAPYAKTPLLPADWKWLNKFFPTDPWVPDTDDDGVNDSAERGAFSYATAEDVATYKEDKRKTVYPGCGLNPCSVDTDMDGIPDGWENQFAGSTVSTNSAWGYIDGMDGTVADAQTNPQEGPNRDYDRDGLENWQEYLTGTMRCWRYDDPFTRWDSIPFEAYYYYDANGLLVFEPDFEALGVKGETSDELWNNFWYETLAHVGGPIYNPHLVFDQSPTAQYFSRVDKGWDPNYFDKVLMGSGGEDDDMAGAEHHYYWFAHRIGAQKYKDAWGSVYGALGSPFGAIEPKIYVSCSPICEDSDQDGMDDFYELFHGLNPMLGGSATPSTIQPCDLVWANKAIDKTGPASWNANPWTVWPFAKARGTDPDYDFTVYPWKNGLQTVDPDGDNERNYVEAIMAKFDSATGFHGDPSPAWMTDASYSNSLTRLHYRMPMRAYGANMSTTVIDRNGDEVPGFTGPDGTVYFFRDFDAYSMDDKAPPGMFEGFGVDRWKVGGARVDARVSQVHYDRGQEPVGGWLYSFEENEGYDTDHDGLNDAAEIAGRAHGATDPIDFDDPRRRQAMYFPGADSALQTPPQLIEQHPVVGAWYDEEFPFREYTVECWVRPDEIRNATVVERAILTAGANAGDRELVRKNFQLAIRKSGDRGYWFTKFDSDGTGTTESDEVSVLSADEVVPGAWTHLAATFDGAHLTLFVNGKPSGTAADTTDSRQQPECGASEINIRTGGTVAGGIYKTDGYVDALGYGYHAIVVGASVRSYSDYDLPFTEQWCGYAINLYNTLGWRFYRDFFKGYVDEIRIWDGARSVNQIAGSMGVRFTAEMAKENRAKVYDQWKAGQSRYRKDGNGRDYEGIEPELRYHFAFDSLLAADSAEALAKVPTGFANGPAAPYSRPDGYEIAWWKRILDTYGSAYAGAANYVTWIPNTVAHLPRFDGTTLDSAFWSADFAGDKSGTYTFANAAEPYSLWTQWLRGNRTGEARSTLLRYNLANSEDYATTGFMNLFMFTGRNRLCEGCDLLPLGGAYARYCEAMWDGQGPSTTHEITGNDSDSDGLPDWWEKYADEQYRGDLDPSVRISWDTIIDYHGMKIAAGEAYLRDLAKGAYGDGNGKIAELPSKYLQIADEDANGIPDWWANLYGIRGESGLADHDNDGLPNYVEYLLSEVFDFKVMFNPVKACSVQREIPDYFYRPAGCQLYVGEIFTDHDLVDDAWEDLYPVSYASRLAWDAFADADKDGWSNRSENRYAKLCMPIVSDKQAHYTAADGLVADYPIPTLNLKLSYNGNSQYDVSTAPMAVQITTDATLAKDPDATYRIGASADTTAGTGTDSKTGSSTSTETAMTRTLGKWSNRHAIGTLTPGNIKQNSLALEFCYDPSSIVYSWDVMIVHIDGAQEIHTKRGTRAEYDADKRKYGDQNVKLLSTAPDYVELNDLELRTDEKSSSATWIHTRSGSELGTINLVTGEYNLNLGIFKDQFVVNGTNENDYVSLEDQTFRIAYTANPSVGLPRELYLGEADTGHVKEGRNTIIAWAETVAADGVWQVGEPYGIVRDVDVSWRGTKAEIELTDLSPVTPRIDLVAAGGSGGESKGGGQQQDQQAEGNPAEVDAASDRGATVSAIKAEIREKFEYDYSGVRPDIYSNALKRLAWMDGNRIEPVSLEGESFRGQRIRVVRWLVNGDPVYLAGAPARVVLDKKIETDVRSCLTEADFLVGNENVFDLDWEHLYNEVIDNGSVHRYSGEVMRVCYLVVIGDGPCEWSANDETGYAVRALNSVIVRKFGESRVKPVAVAPGAVGEEIVHSANPTFKWTMDCPEDRGYTAFRIQVTNNLGTVVYDSDLQLVPPRNDKGQYVWEAPLYVGDKNLVNEKGNLVERLFENKKVYGWKVAMYNAKYSQESNAGYSSGSASFLMQVQTNGYEYGTANVAVRYFGPKSSYQKKNPVIRVRAYTSPDFTGLPVAAGYVAKPDDPANGLTAGTNAAPNCTVVGIPRGTYYLQAFIDSNGNGVCDRWETQGYLCTRDGTTPDYLDPTAITFDSKVGRGDLAVIYLEDADSDGDGLPDAWEFAEFGSLTAKGVDLLTETKAGEFVVNKDYSDALALQENAEVPTAGLAGQVRNMLMKLGSPAGVSAATGIDPADVEVTDGGLEVKSEIDPETLTIVGFAVDAAQNRVLLKVGAETTADINPTVANFLNITVRKGAEVTVKVEHAASPAGPWEVLEGVGGTVTVDRAGADIEVNLTGELPAQGYFRAKVEEK